LTWHCGDSEGLIRITKGAMLKEGEAWDGLIYKEICGSSGEIKMRSMQLNAHSIENRYYKLYNLKGVMRVVHRDVIIWCFHAYQTGPKPTQCIFANASRPIPVKLSLLC
jgi:hypothetical protein